MRSTDLFAADGGHSTSSERTEQRKTLQRLATECKEPGRVLECFYWSGEPGLLETVRAFLELPDDVRTALQTFLAAALVRPSITVGVDADGTLKLHSPEAADLLTTFFRTMPGQAPRH